MDENYLHRSNDVIEYFKIKMVRPHMNDIPSYSLPAGYSFRFYRPDSDDMHTWVNIAKAAGEFLSVEDGLKKFEAYYLTQPDHHLLPERLFFLVNPEGQCIGTTTAGCDTLHGEEQGSLQWVSIIPEYQGKKLAKPMVTHALKIMAEKYTKCYLDSQTTSWRAINMYADLGFQPDRSTEHSEKAWTLLSNVCHRNFL